MKNQNMIRQKNGWCIGCDAVYSWKVDTNVSKESAASFFITEEQLFTKGQNIIF